MSVVIPVYNEARGLPMLLERLGAVFDGLNLRVEAVFVDDGCTDDSLGVLREAQHTRAWLRILSLSRNFGHGAALTAGLDAASGRAVVLMDADLQDRPEAIPGFIKAWEAGAKVVYAVRTARREAAPMRLLFRLFYRMLTAVSGIRIPLDAGVFGLLDRVVVDALKAMPEHHRYFPGLRAFAGFPSTGVPVPRDARYDEKSRVGFRGLFRLASDGLFSFSYLPLRMVTWLGFIVAGVAFVVLISVLYKKLVSGEAITGWASTMTSILFIGGIQLLTLGIVGEYVGRIYEETKRRPHYLVAGRYGFEQQAGTPAGQGQPSTPPEPV